ncbi:hypothetical protein ECG_09581 [Echinococcus granulosus]|uniref:Uncharacterized protein n=1 Tax=Echinococcus granulosus TaxID=6210 RepID=W6UVX3_ECHGR|nr:hypothetical protein EGR_07551 [Echinococcus granulosus]EUB57609.1 hypothetical protein EGR_07551 [Echinococcus granulosus]KAH9277833.1 hypothetical protein ECG_09581 [Echinococcus granulosus]
MRDWKRQGFKPTCFSTLSYLLSRHAHHVVMVRKAADLDFHRTPRLDLTRNPTQEEKPMRVEEDEVVKTRAKSPQLHQPPRSALHRQYMEWMRAMLEVAEDGYGEEGGREQKF